MESLYERQFDSFQAAQEAINAVCRDEGYNLVIHGRRPNASNPTRIILRCCKGRRYTSQHNPEAHKTKARENTSSQMTDCPFRLTVSVREGIHTIKRPVTKPHNHEPMNAAMFSRSRREVIRKYEKEIINAYNSGQKPAVILRKLQRDDVDDVQGINRHDIYNAVRRHRMAELAGRSEVEWLYNQLQNSDAFFYQDERSHDGHITRLFIAPLSGLELLREFLDILFLDCTYKTNRFNLPLLNACGITPLKKTFQFATCFLSGETEDDYRWVVDIIAKLQKDRSIRKPRIIVTDRETALINALKRNLHFNSVPHILCQWHVNMNVLAKCKRFFPKATYDKEARQAVRAPEFTAFLKAWKALISCKSEPDFERELERFQQPGRFPEPAVNYIMRTWINPWKEKIVKCFINQHRHFGYTVTSIVESSNAAMKRILMSSTGDLTSVFRRLQTYWVDQHAKIQQSTTNKYHKTLNLSRKPIYSIIRDKISFVALQLMINEETALEKDPEKALTFPCYPCELVTSYGVLCRHLLWRHTKDKEPIQLCEVDEHWHRYRDRSSPDSDSSKDKDDSRAGPFDPVPIRGKGRPKGALGVEKRNPITGTLREPSAFERAQAAEADEVREARDALQLQPPPSTAPAAISTVRIASREVIEVPDNVDDDPYEPGTEHHRSYGRALDRLADIDSDDASDASDASTPEISDNIEADDVGIVTQRCTLLSQDASCIDDWPTQDFWAELSSQSRERVIAEAALQADMIRLGQGVIRERLDT